MGAAETGRGEGGVRVCGWSSGVVISGVEFWTGGLLGAEARDWSSESGGSHLRGALTSRLGRMVWHSAHVPDSRLIL